MPFEPRTTTPDGRPYHVFFVCGHMRSGTNWTAALLNLHPQINCVGEGPFGHMRTALDVAERNPELYASREPHKTILEEAFSEMVRRTVLSLADLKPYAMWVGENTSRQMWPYVPGSHHFYIVRDGRDVLTSWTFHQLRLGFDLGEPFKTAMQPLVEAFRRDPEYLAKNPDRLLADEQWVRYSARIWKDFIDTGRYAVQQIERVRMDAKVLPLRFESLLTDIEAERSRMYAFLDLDPAQADAVSDDTKTKPGFDHNNPNWFHRSGKAGDWHNYATDKFRKWFKEEAGQSLIDAGYEKDLNW